MDDRIGPILVGLALIVALSANFVFKVRQVSFDIHLTLVFGLVARTVGWWTGNVRFAIMMDRYS